MDIEKLVYTCPKCGSWFTGREKELRSVLVEVPNSSMPKEVSYCPNHKSREVLIHAHEYSLQTPYDKILCEVYQQQVEVVEEQLRELRERIEHHGGEV